MANRRFVCIVFSIALLIGLLVLAAPVSAAPLDAASQQAGGVHIVRAGETLSGIAARYGVSAPALANANGIRNPNFIYAGQRLTIPGAYSGGAAAPAPSAAASGSVHYVQAGESLSAIAARYGTTAAALARANGISNPNHIYAGQRLIIASSGYQQAAYNSGYSGAVGGGAPAAAPVSGGRRWIEINLSSQMLTAYEGNSPVFQRAVSTGLPNTPTPVGNFSIGWKLPSQRMTGPGYDLPNVPWVMYFTNRGHAIHGAYWHNNFGNPMSHGCVNMRTGDAQWLYNFASVGTPVVVRY